MQELTGRKVSEWPTWALTPVEPRSDAGALVQVLVGRRDAVDSRNLLINPRRLGYLRRRLVEVVGRWRCWRRWRVPTAASLLRDQVKGIRETPQP